MDRRDLISRLLKEKGINEKWESFFTIGEGAYSPDGIEDESGYIITQSGRLFAYYLEYRDNLYTLGDDESWIEFVWGTEAGDAVWAEVEDSEEYIKARNRLENYRARGE